MQLPIQENESALVLWALWHHFDKYRDIESIKPLYKTSIKKVADFLVKFRDSETKLPLPSYDLWEERLGVHTFTVSSVCGALTSASNFTAAFGELELSKLYRNTAEEIKKAMGKYMYLKDQKRFARTVTFDKNGGVVVDATLDASLYGLFAFGAYDVNDVEQLCDKLCCNTDVGGLARYEDDPYSEWHITG